jgi:hypothetical protein
MKNEPEYAALVALDWGDTPHAFAWQKTNDPEVHRSSIAATPEALYIWLETIRKSCGGRPVALAIEAGRSGVLHALVVHTWLTIHPATSARFRKPSLPTRRSPANSQPWSSNAAARSMNAPDR